MNKYQEALNNIKTAPSFMGGNARYRSALESSIPFMEDVETLQELVDKETPINMVGVLHNGVTYGFCSYCGGGQHLVEHYDQNQKKWIKQGYCCHCGKKYDWSVKNES